METDAAYVFLAIQTLPNSCMCIALDTGDNCTANNKKNFIHTCSNIPKDRRHLLAGD